jgi:hypothetical protein
VKGQEDYELVYRSPDSFVQVDIISGSVPGQRLVCLVIEEIEDDDDEAGGLRMVGHIRRTINRLEAAQEAIEERYEL